MGQGCEMRGESNEKQPYQFFAVSDDCFFGHSVIYQDVI
jgi:hypothetical protein